MNAPSAKIAAASARRPATFGHVVKRWLYIVHRWIGIVTCLFFAMWFISGVVMVYVPYPSLDTGQRIAGLRPIDYHQVALLPADAANAAHVDLPETVALEMRADQPVWRVKSWEGDESVISADRGQVLFVAGREEAVRIAGLYGKAPVTGIERIERDQWTVAGGYNAHRPLWKATLGGDGGREVYVSSQTGAVVLSTDRWQRFWNWLGSVPHWLYPTVLRQDNDAWRQVVMWVSGPCILGGITGMWIGILRVRLGKRRFAKGQMIPYHGWMAWHHIAGLFGGIALIAWMFSGWLSVDPFHLFKSRRVTVAERQAYAGVDVPPNIDFTALQKLAPDARRIELGWVAGHAVLRVQSEGAPPRQIDARTLAPVTFSHRGLVAAARTLVPDAPLRSVETLTRPDAYWYEIGDMPKLPVLRLRFDDPARTWLHIDPATGSFLGALDSKRRVYRWAFDFLHKWDLNVLTERRPVWDIVVWLLSILGTVTSVTGIWVGWKRLRRKSAS